MKKVIMSLITIISVIISMGVVSVQAETYSGSCGVNVTYTLDTETGVLTISGTGDMRDYTYYSYVPWYSSSTNVKTVVIENGVKSIGNYAFSYCKKLESVSIPDSVADIGEYAFSYSSKLKNVTIPDSVTSIGKNAFYDCSSLVSITIPDSVTSIGDSAFVFCSSLASIDVDTNNFYYSSVDGSLFNEDKTILIQYATGKTNESYIIPNSVTIIGGSAFNGCSNLESVTIGDNVTSIAEGAFIWCSNLESVDIGDSVTSIGNNAFFDCSRLVSVTIPDSVTNIGNDAFGQCSSLKSVDIGGSVTSIGDAAFCWCSSLESIIIPDDVTSIGENAFIGCNNLESVTIGNSVTNIGDSAFYQCRSLESVTIPDNVISIGDSAFSQCGSLESIGIGDSVTSIGDYAFGWCFDLKNVYYRGSADDWNTISIGEGNIYLEDATKVYNAIWVNVKDEMGVVLNKQLVDPIRFKLSNGGYDKVGYTTYFFMDAGLTKLYESDVVSEDITLYRVYSINQYTYKFVDEDGSVLKEASVDYGTIIEAPENPSKESTAQYTYTFAGWDGYADGMVVTSDATFTAKYNRTVNKYTYTFLDVDGTVLKEKTVDYGTVIAPPDMPTYDEPYTFDCWIGFETSMTVTEDVTFVAQKKYMDYVITVDGIYIDGESVKGEDVIVTYGSDYTLPFVDYASYNFLGYYTDVDGSGAKVTDESGNSLEPYSIIGDTILYPYYEHICLDEILFFGDETATVGQEGISEAVCFVTKAEATKLYFEVEYPEVLSFVEAVAVDFESVTEESIKTENGITILVLTAQYADDENIPTNSMVCPFELVFDVSTDCELGDIEISISNGTSVIGTGNYGFMTLDKQKITIEPKLAESIYLTGEHRINKPTQFKAEVYPSHTADKSVTWSVTDGTIATIDENGMVTLIKAGRVGIKATTNDGSNLYSILYIDVVEDSSVSQYTYTFLDFDGNVFFEKTAEYGTVIEKPENTPDIAQPYEFDYWEGFTEDLILVEDISFKPVAKFQLNRTYVEGNQEITAGDEAVAYTISFGTDKEAEYAEITLRYPNDLTFEWAEPVEFADVSVQEKQVFEEYTEITFLCMYSFEGQNMPTGTPMEAFKVMFDVSLYAGGKELTIECTDDSILIGEEDYPFVVHNGKTTFVNGVAPERIFIPATTGATYGEPIQPVAIIYPDYADKRLKWSISDETIANIDENTGLITPIKSGKVTVTATSVVNSLIRGSWNTEIYLMSTIDSLVSDKGVWDSQFIYYYRDYTIYVNEDDISISLTPTYDGGTVKCDGALLRSGVSKTFALNDEITVIELQRGNVSGAHDIKYTITVIKTDKPLIVTDGNGGGIDVLLNTNVLPEFEKATIVVATYDSEGALRTTDTVAVSRDDGVVNVPFDSPFAETVKVMLWNSKNDMVPICEAVLYE